MSTTDFEAFREYHWLDTPDAAGPAGHRHGMARTSTPIRDATMAAVVALASLEDLDTLSPLSADVGDGRKLTLPDEGSGTGDEGCAGVVESTPMAASAIKSSRKHFNLDLDMDATSTKTTTTTTSTTTATKARKTTTFEKGFKPDTHSNRGTSPMNEIIESPDSVHSARFGRGDSPAIKLVIGRKEIKTSDTSAITESRLTVYGHKDVEISISSQSTISLTTTHTSKDGREKTAEMSSSGGEVKEVSTGKRYKQFKLVDDPDSEQTERKRDDAVSFSKKKSVYLFGSFDSSSGSPITETSVSQHVTDTGISLTRGFTETMTSPGVISSSAEEKNKKVSIITDTAVDVEIEELELTDAGLSPILPDETDVTADFQMAEEDVHFAHTGTSPMDFEEQSVSAAMDTSEAATLTDRVETKDASNSPLDVPITSILKRDVSKLTDEELLTGRRGSGDVKAKIKMLEQNQKAHSAQSSPKKKVEFEEHQLKIERQDSPKRQKASGKITELRKLFGEEEEPVESNVMSESIPPIQEVIKQLEKRIAVHQVDRKISVDQVESSTTRGEALAKRVDVDVDDLNSQIIPVKIVKVPECLTEQEQQISKLVHGVQSLGLQEEKAKQLEQEKRNAEQRAALDEPVCEKLADRKFVPELVKGDVEEDETELRKANDLIKMFEMKQTTTEETIKSSPKRKHLPSVTEVVEQKVTETVVEKVEAKPDDKPEQDEQPEPSEPVSDVVEEKVTEVVEQKVTETVVEKVEAKPDDKPEQDEQPEPS
uniref:Uncharacterized protein n=1 Tax=Anopheles maculatus TaxID=74869 RepID=A0A182S7W8_9DIPT